MKRSLALLLLVCVLTGCVGVKAGPSAPEDDTSPTSESSPAPSAPVTPPAEEETPATGPAPTIPPIVAPGTGSGTRGPAGPPADRAPEQTRPVPQAPAPVTVTPPVRPELGSPTPGVPGLAEIVLGTTTDESGNAHSLALTVSPAARNAVQAHGRVFAVISGSSLAVSGDVAVGEWRLAVDSDATGDAAPIVVVKAGPGQTVQQLAAEPAGYADAAGLNDDVAAISARLTALVADVITKAQAQNPHAAFYAPLAASLTDPTWTGTVVFNATVSTLPGTVNGHSTGPQPEPHTPVVAMGFESPSGAYFGVVDYSRDPGAVSPGSIQYLRALFVRDALTAFELG